MEQVQSTKAARTHLPGKAKVGFAILAVYVLLGVFGPILLPFDPDDDIVYGAHLTETLDQKLTTEGAI